MTHFLLTISHLLEQSQAFHHEFQSRVDNPLQTSLLTELQGDSFIRSIQGSTKVSRRLQNLSRFSALEAMSSSRWNRTSFIVSVVGLESCDSFQWRDAMPSVGFKLHFDSCRLKWIVANEEQNNPCNQHQSHGVTSSRKENQQRQKNISVLMMGNYKLFAPLISLVKIFPPFYSLICPWDKLRVFIVAEERNDSLTSLNVFRFDGNEFIICARWTRERMKWLSSFGVCYRWRSWKQELPRRISSLNPKLLFAHCNSFQYSLTQKLNKLISRFCNTFAVEISRLLVSHAYKSLKISSWNTDT